MIQRELHRIEIVAAWIECPFCPTIIVGQTFDGQTVYARYRSGVLSVRFDPRNPAPHGGAWGLVLMEGQYGDSDDGHLTYDELRERSKNIVAWPDEPSLRPLDSEEKGEEADPNSPDLPT